MGKYVIYTLKGLHFLVMIYMVFGWVLPGKVAHVSHLVFVILVIIQWQFNDGTCLLTNIENMISREKTDRDEQQGQFVKSILGRFLSKQPTDAQLKITIYGVILSAAGLSLFRLMVG